MDLRRLLVLMVLGAWLLLGPIAMAFASCDGVCEGPCGLPPALASAGPNETTLAPQAGLALPARNGLPGIVARVLEPPPKPAPLPA